MPSCYKVMPGAAILLLLSACGSDAGVGGVTASEADALNRAAATLDQSSSAAKSPDVGLNPAAVAARDRTRITNDSATVP